MPDRFLRYTLHTKSWNLKQIIFHVVQKNLLPFPVSHPWNSCNGHSWYIICILQTPTQKNKGRHPGTHPIHTMLQPTTNHLGQEHLMSCFIIQSLDRPTRIFDAWRNQFLRHPPKKGKKQTPGWWLFQTHLKNYSSKIGSFPQPG